MKFVSHAVKRLTVSPIVAIKERLRELRPFSLAKRRLHGDLIAALQYTKGAYKKDGERLSTKACSDRTGAIVLK